MDHRTSRVGELFCSQQQFQFSCLQRQNRWQTKHWRQFWNSVETLAHNDGGSVGTFPLGTLILVDNIGVWSGIKQLTVIDGQHRLVACSTLLAALRDWMRDHGNEMGSLEIQHSYLSHPFRSGSDAHKIVLSCDTPSHVSIISSAERADTPEWILDVYDLFYKGLSKSRVDAIRIFWALTSNMSVILAIGERQAAIKMLSMTIATGVPGKKSLYR